jgi:hypothetical protein
VLSGVEEPSRPEEKQSKQEEKPDPKKNDVRRALGDEFSAYTKMT